MDRIKERLGTRRGVAQCSRPSRPRDNRAVRVVRMRSYSWHESPDASNETGARTPLALLFAKSRGYFLRVFGLAGRCVAPPCCGIHRKPEFATLLLWQSTPCYANRGRGGANPFVGLSAISVETGMKYVWEGSPATAPDSASVIITQLDEGAWQGGGGVGAGASQGEPHVRLNRERALAKSAEPGRIGCVSCPRPADPS